MIRLEEEYRATGFKVFLTSFYTHLATLKFDFELFNSAAIKVFYK